MEWTPEPLKGFLFSMISITYKEHNKISGIYGFKWNNNDYTYIGQSVNLYNRARGHKQMLNRGIHHNIKIQRVFNRYGMPEIYLIELCGIEDLDFVEQKYLDIYFDGCNKCLNILKIASSSIGHKMPPKSKEYREAASKRMKGVKKSPEHVEKMRLVNTGKVISQQTKDKISKALKGRVFSDEHIKNMGISCKGRVFSETHRANIGKTKIGNSYTKGMKWSEEQKAKMSKIQKANTVNIDRIKSFNIDRKKKINQLDMNGNFIRSFESITDAGNHGYGRKEIGYCISGRHSQHKGFKWERGSDGTL